MPILKVKINGVWYDITDADTLDGKHADEFALASDVEQIREQSARVQIITWEADD